MAAGKTVLVVLGTRPEAIKLSPLVLAGKNRSQFDFLVCNTGQHRQMSDQVLELFGLHADFDLDIMRAEQTLTGITVDILTRMQDCLDRCRPDWVVVQGDTTTSFAAALAAFYRKVPVAHVEAGLRTGNIYAPWPEEMNRRLVSELATLHFPPTRSAAENLLAEGIPPDRMLVTGNTGIDALKGLVKRLTDDAMLQDRAAKSLNAAGLKAVSLSERRPYVLVTCHRRESFGAGLEAICSAILQLAGHFPGYDFIYPVHPNPRVRETVNRLLGSGIANVQLIEPLEYLPFVSLMADAELILTDSGGVQEEAPSLGKRVVVLRDETERTEGLDTGLIRLAGTNPDKITASTIDALEGRWPLADSADVYGDGLASERIIDTIAAHSPV
ncbi:non-hydrolyzing UDP-N-acetylglucosamine 2-epimerase [Methylomonas koyamae]|uniref:non-hydrolyzing UDP-N-acetylglucosamine 2-epimerase n=1 Tax=Methylomonas koyamae TaxID=702114 RepID=UPI00112B163C|nr:UDP-N-acetylglucosamine 2-epimerase (non-hydrolyzing) [Methylomonas koyamae]TPQ28510.1 UDP-N-acetylglucosamine 2-epimerase (non-hydrolyzing) [Methylomonas koyamae]